MFLETRSRIETAQTIEKKLDEHETMLVEKEQEILARRSKVLKMFGSVEGGGVDAGKRTTSTVKAVRRESDT